MVGASDEFATTLRAAIRDSGLSLDRLRHRLAEHGVRISVATLSYWQSGRSQPERADSLAAIGQLERILGLTDRALLGLLPARPARRWTTHHGPDQWDAHLTRISQHDRFEVGAGREEVRTTVRQVLRADVAGPDRALARIHLDQPAQPPPVIRALRGCRLGTIEPTGGAVRAHLMFDHVLARGETVVMEYEVSYPDQFVLATNYAREFQFGIREYVLEVRFHPAAVPSRCWQFAVAMDISVTDGERARVRRVWPDRENTLHGVVLDRGPGEFGFRWSWS